MCFENTISDNINLNSCFLSIFHFPVAFLWSDHYSNLTLTHLVILMAIDYIRHIFGGIINPFQIYQVHVFSRNLRYYMHNYEIQFSRNLGKKRAPTDTTVGAYFSTIVQPFPNFRKLLAIIPSMQNHPHFRILNQKFNTNNKFLMLLSQLVL